MDWPQFVVLLLGGGVVGVVFKTLTEQWNLSRKTKASERRKEIDRAVAAERAARILRESLEIHRVVIIKAECLGPEYLPDYPATSSTSIIKSQE